MFSAHVSILHRTFLSCVLRVLWVHISSGAVPVPSDTHQREDTPPFVCGSVRAVQAISRNTRLLGGIWGLRPGSCGQEGLYFLASPGVADFPAMRCQNLWTHGERSRCWPLIHSLLAHFLFSLPLKIIYSKLLTFSSLHLVLNATCHQQVLRRAQQTALPGKGENVSWKLAVFSPGSQACGGSTVFQVG